VARTFAEPAEDLRTSGPAVIVLSPDLLVRSQTDDAAVALLRLLPPDEPMTPIPAAAYNIGAALIAQEQGIPVGEPWSRVRLGANRWVTVRASRLGEDIAVSMEASTAGREDGPLRPGPRTLLAGVRDPHPPRHRARLTGDRRSVVPVRAHRQRPREAALAKTSARTRQVLLARATGSR